MNFKLKLSFLTLLCAVIAFSACKKSSSNPSTVAPKEVATQVALNISQSLFGSLGFDLSGGLNAPSSFAVNALGGKSGSKAIFSVPGNNTQRRALTSLTNPDCGLVVDTALTFTIDDGINTATIAGTFGFSFSCTNNIVSGYNTHDNLTISLVNTSVSYTYKVVENVTLTSLNPTDDNSNISMHGTLASNGAYQLLTGTKKSGTQAFSYTLSSLIFSPVSGDIISGSASFTTSGTGANGTWNYQGTITFLGNQTAKVTINGTAYTVNLQTGAVS